MARARQQHKRDEEASLLLNRRSYLTLAGSAVAAAVGSDTARAQTATGYGEAGYGDTPYGGEKADSGAPTIESFSLAKSDKLGDDRMTTVNWEVSDPEGDLDVVEVVVNDGSVNMNFTVTDVNGKSAAGWEIFQFPLGTSLNVHLRVTDTAGNTTKESQSITL